jgi:hypothetical protein
MKRLRRSLQALTKNLKALTEKAEKMTKALDKLEKTQVKAVPRRKAVAKKVAVKKAAPKKAAAKKAAAKKVAAKKVAAKKVATKRVIARKAKVSSATEKVLGIIKKSRKGIDTGTLREETGYNNRKIWDIVHRAYKEGKIKKVGRGTYMKA